MAITRRQFLKCGGTAAAGALLAPRLFGIRFVQDALAADRQPLFRRPLSRRRQRRIQHRRPDAAATLRPWYEAARKTGAGGLRLDAPSLANTAIGNDPNTGVGARAPSRAFAARPTAPRRRRRWSAGSSTTTGNVAVIQGCGYPSYSLSHEDSRLIWQTGDPSLSAVRRHGLGRPPSRVGLRRTADGNPRREHRRLASPPISVRERPACSPCGACATSASRTTGTSTRPRTTNARKRRVQCAPRAGRRPAPTRASNTSALPARRRSRAPSATRRSQPLQQRRDPQRLRQALRQRHAGGREPQPSRDLLEVAKVIWRHRAGRW